MTFFLSTSYRNMEASLFDQPSCSKNLSQTVTLIGSILSLFSSLYSHFFTTPNYDQPSQLTSSVLTIPPPIRKTQIHRTSGSIFKQAPLPLLPHCSSGSEVPELHTSLPSFKLFSATKTESCPNSTAHHVHWCFIHSLAMTIHALQFLFCLVICENLSVCVYWAPSTAEASSMVWAPTAVGSHHGNINSKLHSLTKWLHRSHLSKLYKSEMAKSHFWLCAASSYITFTTLKKK